MGETALPILAEVAKPLVKVVASRVTEEIRLIVGLSRELKNLEENIKTLEDIVDDITAVPEAVEPWLKKTIRIIHNAEDMLDVSTYYKHRSAVMKKRRTQNKPFSNKIRLVFLPLEQLYLRTKIAHWIRRINSDIEALVKKAKLIKDLKDLGRSDSLKPAARNTANDDQLLREVRRNVATSRFFGRDSDVERVVEKLVCNPAQNSDDKSTNRLPVVAIVGIGGLGKTTLAKKVLENDRVKVHFSERIWISESKDFKIEMVLNKMAEILEEGKYEVAGNSEATIRKLERHLCGKRFLLVLDDVWNINQHLWDSMRDVLERIDGSNDSMILMTSRDEAVAERTRASIHHLPSLSEDASLLLFEEIAFANWSDGAASKLKAAGRNIVEKCKGVPLAIKSIAGTLNKKKFSHEWRNIERSELWNIEQGGVGVLPSLRLSYNHLSPRLRKCFPLCACWPKSWWFYKHELICRWIALGLIQNPSEPNMTMEDSCEDYINDLLSISFLLVREKTDTGEAKSYELHDLVYDLARSVAMHERLYLEDGNSENRAVNIQHLTILDYAKITSDFPNKEVLENMRSLDMQSNLPEGLLVHVKYLRVLCLQNSSIEVVPESIGKLKCLKYLDLENNPIKVLPDCICKLYNLQSLCLIECKPLSKLPRGLSNLVNLRHLLLSFPYCPEEEGVIKQLIQLRTLPPLQLSEGGFQISELGCLHHVSGVLNIKGLELIKNSSDAERSQLSMKPRVKKLRLIWDNDDNYENHKTILHSLRPDVNLKVLSIKGFGGENFPSWLMKMNENSGILCHLIRILLIDCKRCQQLPTMGHLPLLKWIGIKNMENLKRIGPEFYGEADLLSTNSNEASSSGGSSSRVKSMEHFQSLTELRLIDLGNLEEWCEPAGPGMWTGFPSMELLVIQRCWKLKEAPDKFPKVKELIVGYMSSSNPLIKIMSNKSSVSCLTKLEIGEVQELTHIPPKAISECTSLQTLIIWSCPKLESISNLSALGSLRQLDLSGNDALSGVPEGLESCKLLEDLTISCCGKVETLPRLAGLSRLCSLNISGMSKMIRQPPDWLFKLPSLGVLHIGVYKGLNEFPDISCLKRITSLDSLFLYGWEELQKLPQQLEHFTALKTLGICDSENVEKLPDWLGNLSSLEHLYLVRCERLTELPSKEALERLPNFKYIEIDRCPVLEPAIKENGSEYHKIAADHIQVEVINSTS